MLGETESANDGSDHPKLQWQGHVAMKPHLAPRCHEKSRAVLEPFLISRPDENGSQPAKSASDEDDHLDTAAVLASLVNIHGLKTTGTLPSAQEIRIVVREAVQALQARDELLYAKEPAPSSTRWSEGQHTANKIYNDRARASMLDSMPEASSGFTEADSRAPLPSPENDAMYSKDLPLSSEPSVVHPHLYIQHKFPGAHPRASGPDNKRYLAPTSQSKSKMMATNMKQTPAIADRCMAWDGLLGHSTERIAEKLSHDLPNIAGPFPSQPKRSSKPAMSGSIWAIRAHSIDPISVKHRPHPIQEIRVQKWATINILTSTVYISTHHHMPEPVLSLLPTSSLQGSRRL